MMNPIRFGARVELESPDDFRRAFGVKGLAKVQKRTAALRKALHDLPDDQVQVGVYVNVRPHLGVGTKKVVAAKVKVADKFSEILTRRRFESMRGLLNRAEKTARALMAGYKIEP